MCVFLNSAADPATATAHIHQIAHTQKHPRISLQPRYTDSRLLLFSLNNQLLPPRDEYRRRALQQYAGGRCPDFHWGETTRLITHGPQQQQRRSELSSALHKKYLEIRRMHIKSLSFFKKKKTTKQNIRNQIKSQLLRRSNKKSFDGIRYLWKPTENRRSQKNKHKEQRKHRKPQEIIEK